MLLRQLHSFESVFRFGNDFEVFALEQRAHALSHNGVVISNEDSYRHVYTSTGISIVSSVPLSPLSPRRREPPRAQTRSLISVRPRPGRRLRNPAVLSKPVPSSRTEQNNL